MNPRGGGAAIVDRELHKQEIRLMPKYVVPESEDPEIRSGAPDGRMNFIDSDFGELPLEPCT